MYPYYAITQAALADMHRWYRQHQAVSGFVQAQAVQATELMQGYATFIRQDIKGHWPHLIQMASQQGVSVHTLAQTVHRAGVGVAQTYVPAVAYPAKDTSLLNRVRTTVGGTSTEPKIELFRRVSLVHKGGQFSMQI